MESNPPPSYRAVLIGIDNYPQKALGGCVNDIDQIEGILLDRLGVPPERITRFAAPQAGASSSRRLPSLNPTCDELRSFLNRLAGEVTKSDLVFLYYSGHGSQLMTELNGQSLAREALVPLDYWNGDKPSRLLYDFELNGLLANIADRAGDLTVVLDCCHSASATREDGLDRYLPIPGVQDLSSQVFFGAPPGKDVSGLQSAAAVHMLIAACRASERAYEVPAAGGKPPQGAFSRALVQILESTDRPLPDLRWQEIWARLVDHVSRFNSVQHPELVGRGERHLFGGPWTPRDLGYAIRQEGEGFRIEAGTLTGVSEGAEVAVYGAEPAQFPELNSAADQAARQGLLRVEKADRSFCTAVSADGSLSLPSEARGRLVSPGQPDRLTISLDPFDPGLAASLDLWGITALSAGSPGVEARLRCANDLLHLGDEIYGEGRDPLVSFPARDPGLAGAVLDHYARYRHAIRLADRCQDLPGALRVSLLDCRIVPDMTKEELQAPSLPALPIDPIWGCKVKEGEGFALQIDNQAKQSLSAFVLNCAGSGRVEYLGLVEIPPGARHVLWCDGILGNPFYPAVGTDRPAIIDRLIVVGTTLPDRDLSYLQLHRSFAEVLKNYREDGKDTLARAAATPPVEQWTAVRVTLQISR